MKQHFLAAIALFAGIATGCVNHPNNSSSAATSPVSIQDWKQVLKSEQNHSIEGNVKIINQFPVHSLGTTRNIWIYLPPGYEESDSRYPVLYMHDGQNLFDKATSYAGEWGIDETMERLSADNEAFKMIVVGVENGPRRMYDYTPYPNSDGLGGDGAKYVAFLTDELKPFIDKSFRTKPNSPDTYISGSSLGGYISVYAGLERPDIFGNVLAFSNVFQIGQKAFFGYIGQLDRTLDSSRFYLDIGTIEDQQFSYSVSDNRKVLEMLQAKGVSEDRLKLYIDPVGDHNESAWNRRFPDALKWILEREVGDKK
ncbi:alpha/beta hydrolase [Cohnella faecalis]|uniref:Alpha/beta hydrolase n=1 Tax=Cohnella faecalis TaxID=2315694 RepID=A0A398CQA4_9BACL|nr:alpha/beta hydrolase-fold protein [Cohnella faecalis]RIE04693.1 alpha/beta hydrolase [Cohnella faecalis]